MTGKSSERYGRISAAWLAACGAALVCFSVFGDRIPIFFRGKLFGIFGSFSVAVLCGIGYAAGELFWLDVPECRKDRRSAARLFWIFLAGTVLQILYAVYASRHGRVSMLQDSMVTSGIFCVTVLVSRWRSEL